MKAQPALPSTPHRGRHRPGLRALVIAAVVAMAVSFPAGATAAPVSIRLHFPSHTVHLNKNWKLSVNVRKGVRRVSGKARFRFLFGGLVVNTQAWKRFRNGHVTFVLHPTTKSAGAGLGLRLTLQVQVRSRAGDRSASTWIRLAR